MWIGRKYKVMPVNLKGIQCTMTQFESRYMHYDAVDQPASLSTTTTPADFEAFWARTIDELSRIPLDPKIALDPMRSTKQVLTYEVSWASWQGLRISGWYCVPAEGTAYPGLVISPGYRTEPPIPRSWAEEG